MKAPAVFLLGVAAACALGLAGLQLLPRAVPPEAPGPAPGEGTGETAGRAAATPPEAERHGKEPAQHPSQGERREAPREETAPPGPVGEEQGRFSHLRIEIVDAESGAALAGARVFDGSARSLLATAGPEGRVALRDRMVEELVFAKDGWLLFGLPVRSEGAHRAREALRAGEVLRVELREDRWTVPLRLAFRREDGGPAPGTRFLLRKMDHPPVTSLELPRFRRDPAAPLPREAADAWRAHVFYARLGTFTEARHHFGMESEGLPMQAGPSGSVEVRLLAPGVYRLEAVSPAGERAEKDVTAAATDEEPVAVRLGSGLSLWGRVLSVPAGAPLAGAQVSLSPAPLLLEPARTDKEGHFLIQGLGSFPRTLDVRAEGHEAVSVGPFRPGSEVPQVLLPSLREMLLAGRVVEMGTNRPVAEAQVETEEGPAARTDAHGVFRLALRGGRTECLAIRAAGYQPYGEALDLERTPPPLVFPLVPSDPDDQVRARIVARLRGRVLGEGDRPVAGAVVDLVPEEAPTTVGTPGRAVLEGGLPPHTARTLTGASGEFTLLTPFEGAMRIVVRDGEGRRAEQVQSVVRGLDRAGLVLRPAPR